jgi:hypothetical protein
LTSLPAASRPCRRWWREAWTTRRGDCTPSRKQRSQPEKQISL